MVTIIENEAAVCENPYPGMNLAEACMQLQLEASEIVNDLNMSVLLDEHAYLLENGVELDYLTEGEKFDAMKQKIRGALETVGKKIGELFDKVIEWFVDRRNEIVEFFAKHSIDRKHIGAAEKALGEIGGVDCKLTKDVDYGAFAVEYKDLFADSLDAYPTDHGFDYYVKEVKAEAPAIRVNVEMFKQACDVIFTSNSMLKNIKECKNAANKALNEIKRQVKAARGDDLPEQLGKVNDLIHYNTEKAKMCSKVYHAYVNENIEIIRCVFADKHVKDVIAGAKVEEGKQRVENLKAVPGKTVEAVKKAPGNVYNSVVKKTQNLKNK